MKTLIDLLMHSVAKYGSRLAFVSDASALSESWHYEDLGSIVNSIARWLRHQHHLSAGEKILLIAENSPRLAAFYLGAMQARVVLVPLAPESPADFIHDVIKSTAATAVFYAGSPPDIPILPAIDINTLKLDLSAKPLDDLPSSSDLVEIMFTSGPTGKPRGVMLTQENILANVLSVSTIVDQDQHWRMLSILPLSHMLEQTVGLFTPLYLGATIYYGGIHKPANIIKVMQRHRITSMVVVPKLLDVLMRGIEREVRRRGQWARWQQLNRFSAYIPMRFRRLLFRSAHSQFGGAFEYFVSGGAHLDTELWRRWEHIGVKVIQGYGATECSPVITSNTQYHRVVDSVGAPLSGVQIRLSQQGELQVHGKNVTNGYWQDERFNTRAFTPDGWYRTGDLATRDKRGHVFLRGHLNDTIVLANGINIFPQDLEKALAVVPSVKTAVVMGVEDTSGNTEIVASVLLNTKTADSLSQQKEADAAAKKASATLGPHHQISRVQVWQGNDFPREQSGLVQRWKVKETLKQAKNDQGKIAQRAPASEETIASLWRIVSQISGTNQSELQPETELENIGLTSLAQVELVTSLENSLGVTIDDQQFAEVQTLGELLELLRSGDSAPKKKNYRKWPFHTLAIWLRLVLQAALVFNMHRLVAHPFEVRGLRKLASVKQPTLFIANHSSHIDTLSILRATPLAVRKKIAIAAASDYFFKSRLLGAASSLLLNTFPFSRGAEARRSLEYSSDLIHNGWSILIYPEGTRSTTGMLLPFKGGIGLLAKELHAPVIPIAVYGGFDILPKGRNVPHPGPAKVVFGDPIYPDVEMSNEALVLTLQQSLADLIELGQMGEQQ